MKKILFATFIFAALPVVSSAGIITFAGFPDGTVLTTQDFGDGVTFAGATILQCCESDSTGSLNNFQFPPPADDGGNTDGVNVAFNASGPLILDFTTPIDAFSAAFTYDDGLTLTAFNNASTAIGVENGICGASGSGSNRVGSTCGPPDEVVSLNVAGISSIVITGGTGDNFTIDDVTFAGAINAGAAPEPGTIAMVLGGLGCIAAFGRRQRSAARESSK